MGNVLVDRWMNSCSFVKTSKTHLALRSAPGLNFRLKANNARWRIENVGKMAGVCSAIDSDCWNNFWNAA